MKTGVFRGGCLTGAFHSAVDLHGFLADMVRIAVRGETYRIIGHKDYPGWELTRGLDDITEDVHRAAKGVGATAPRPAPSRPPVPMPENSPRPYRRGIIFADNPACLQSADWPRQSQDEPAPHPRRQREWTAARTEGLPRNQSPHPGRSVSPAAAPPGGRPPTAISSQKTDFRSVLDAENQHDSAHREG